MLLASCATIKAEGSVPTEGYVRYSGPMLQVYKNAPDRGCELTKEQKIKLLGEVEHNDTTYVKVSRNSIEDPGSCDLTAYQLLIDEGQLWGSQPLFPTKEK